MALQNVSGMPDLQLRMSKKIAQLTKVIYHLNNKNEDHDIDLQELAEQYETEIEQILRDTADKINFFKQQLDAANDEVRIREIAKQLEAKYEEERRRCLQEIDTIRKRATDKEAAIQKAATKQIEGLTTQVEDLQRQLQQRIREVNDLSTNANSSSKELQDALARARQETEDAIQTHNKKYNDMLADRMRMEDSLQDQVNDLTAKLAAAGTGRAALELQMAEQLSKWETEKGQMLEEQKSMDGRWKGKVEALLEELQKEKTGAKDQARQAAGAEAEAATRIRDLEASLARTDADLKSKGVQVEKLTYELSALRTEMGSLQDSSQQRIDELSQQLKEARDEISKTQRGAAGDKEAFDNAALTAKAEQDRIQMLLAQALSDLKQTKSKLDQSALDLQKKTAELATSTAEFEEQVAQLNKKIKQLEEQIRQAVQAGQSDAAAAANQMRDQAQRQLVEAEAAHRKALEAAKQEGEGQLQAANKEAAMKLAGLEGQLRKEMTDLKSRLEKEKQDALTGMLGSHSKEADALSRERSGLQAQLADLTQQLAAQQAARTAAEAECVRLRGELDSSGKNLDATKGQLEQRLKAVSASEAGLKDELKEVKAALAAAEAKVASLQAQLDALQKQATGDRKAAQEQLAAELARLDQDWANKAAQQVKSAVSDKEALFQREMAALRENLSLQGDQQASAVQSALRVEMEELRRRMQQEAEGLKQVHKQELQSQQQRHEQALLDLRAQHQQALAKLQDHASSSQADGETRLRAEMASALQRAEEHEMASMQALTQELTQRHQAALADQAAQHRTAVEAAQKALAEEKERAVGHARNLAATHDDLLNREVDRLTQAKAEALAALTRQHEAELAALTTSHNGLQATSQASLAAMERDRDALQKKVLALETQGEALQQRVVEVQTALANKAAEAADTLFRVKQEHVDEKENLLRSHRQDRESLIAEAQQVQADLRQQMLAAAAEAEERYAELAEQYTEARRRLDAREPREEDIRRIAELESSLSIAMEQVRTAEERMAQLRAELLLREESYNKHFKNGGMGEKMLNVGAAMNADSGVMDWMLKNRKTSGREPITAKK